MATYKVGRAEKIANLAAKLMVRAGMGPGRIHLLTVVGRKTGRSFTTPVTILESEAGRWLVAPYGTVAWVKNARASGRVTLSRRGYRQTLAVREVEPATAAPILKAYLAIEPITRSAFGLSADAPLEEWQAIAPKHPVFRLEPLPTPHNPG